MKLSPTLRVQYRLPRVEIQYLASEFCIQNAAVLITDFCPELCLPIRLSITALRIHRLTLGRDGGLVGLVGLEGHLHLGTDTPLCRIFDFFS
jgi:hypothetical protein